VIPVEHTAPIRLPHHIRTLTNASRPRPWSRSASEIIRRRPSPALARASTRTRPATSGRCYRPTAGGSVASSRRAGRAASGPHAGPERSPLKRGDENGERVLHRAIEKGERRPIPMPAWSVHGRTSQKPEARRISEASFGISDRYASSRHADIPGSAAEPKRAVNRSAICRLSLVIASSKVAQGLVSSKLASPQSALDQK
jgi:hypothetical protein